MTFSEGKTVIHPIHGPGQVLSLSSRSVRGRAEPYVSLYFAENRLRISLPIAAAADIGIRQVLTPSGAEEIFDALRAPSIALPTMFARRMKELQELLSRGTVEHGAIVVRELERKDPERRSMGERQILKGAKNRLAGELALALEQPIEAVIQLIEAAATDVLAEAEAAAA